MTDFTFARVGLRYNSFHLPKEPGKKNDKTGFDNNKTGIEDLQRCEKFTLIADLNELLKTIHLLPVNSIPVFTFISKTSVYQNCNPLLIQTPNSFNCSAFHVLRSVLYVPYYTTTCSL